MEGIAERKHESLPPMRIVVLDAHTVNPGDNSWRELKRYGDGSNFTRRVAAKGAFRGHPDPEQNTS
jgi:hypothetical protein